MHRLLLPLPLLALSVPALACSDSSSPDAGSLADADTASDLDAGPTSGLPVLNVFDPARASAGESFLHQDWPGRPAIPKQALSYLWLVWGTGPVSEEQKWDEIEKRYGLFRETGAAWPVGLLEADAQNLSFNCLLCHATRGTSPGEVWIGVGNARLNLDRLYRDLVTLAGIAEANGLGTFAIPYDLSGSTQAPGAVDGVGLGMLFAGTIDTLGETFGYQQASAWWTMRYKERLYSDGAGRVDNWRTMMSTLFSFGMSQSEIQSYDLEFQDLRHYLLSLEPPSWPFTPPAADQVQAGAQTFAAHCASCHGSYQGSAAHFPELIVASEEVGTDATREAGMDDFQVGVINSSWYGEPAAWDNTGDYLATPLVGVWATAPYFHNGSVPDLAGVLDSSQRPTQWYYTPEHTYDANRVGWAYALSGDPQSVYDTSKASLSNQGHNYGDALSQAEREALLEYLKTL